MALVPKSGGGLSASVDWDAGDQPWLFVCGRAFLFVLMQVLLGISKGAEFCNVTHGVVQIPHQRRSGSFHCPQCMESSLFALLIKGRVS